ncbi:hypothetical protein R3I93_008328 [Phoxinus phoxinus]|uniref:Uncharacterized protein n=1 Tax=Phoxinus phoxinus TaxID=58324 RepID=A0AAN9D5S6_9TELE
MKRQKTIHSFFAKKSSTIDQETGSLGLSGQKEDDTQQKETSQTEPEVTLELRGNEAESFKKASEVRENK